MRLKAVKTLKGKITWSIVLFSLVFSTVVSGIVYVNYRDLLIKNMIEVTLGNTHLIVDKMDEDFEKIKTIMEWGTLSSDLSKILVYEEMDENSGPKVVNFIKLFSEVIKSSNVDNYIEKIVIGGETEISIQMGNIYGSVLDVEICRNSDWFEPLLGAQNLSWIGLEENPFSYAQAEHVIPIVRPVYSHLKRRDVGFLMVGVNSRFLSDYVRNYSAYEDGETFLCNAGGQIIAHSDARKNGTYVDEMAAVLGSIGDRSSGSITGQDEDGTYTSVFYQSEVTGWYLIQKISNHELDMQKQVIINILVIVVSLIIGMAVLLSFVLHNYINKPIVGIRSKIDEISEGDFSFNGTIEREDELGEIGKGINKMSQSIETLIEKSVSDEKNKKEMELKLLQTQVNPHFLYNTLNSIKWMATIQKASGIGEMSTALSRLLRNMAKGVADEISIGEEIELVNDYVTIQKYRYGESFTVEYDVEEGTKDCKIVKFTLQPLVENAIFHGLEPKSGIGVIQIKVSKTRQDVLIRIRDNGVGLDRETADRILSGEVGRDKNSLNGIGVSNVNDRLLLMYGAGYGLRISSEIDEFTEIIIRIPMRR